MSNSKASKLMLISSFGVVATAAIGLLAYSFWNESRIKDLSHKLRTADNQNYNVQKQLGFLTSGCNKSGKRASSFPPLIAELVRGNCHSLSGIKVPPTYFNEPNLSNLDFQGADFSRSYLVGAQFSMSDLTKAKLKQANLSGANLSVALLQEANFQQANLSYAKIHNSNLQEANLQAANLSGANFIASNLSKVDFSNADLQGVTLTGAVAPDANFHNANLQDAILFNVDLRRAINLTDQQLQGEQAPLMCKAWLPEDAQSNPNRDCSKLPSILKKRFPWHFATDEMAAKSISSKIVTPPSGMYPVPNGGTFHYAP